MNLPYFILLVILNNEKDSKTFEMVLFRSGDH